jgi:hypothetical protein
MSIERIFACLMCCGRCGLLAVEEMDSMSLCGKEINYIAHADRLSPFTFKEKFLSEDGSSSCLLYGGSLRQPYRPELLAYHAETGRIYHQITQHRHYEGEYGLLHPHLCLEIGEDIVYDEDRCQYVFKPGQSCYPLKFFGLTEDK